MPVHIDDLNGAPDTTGALVREGHGQPRLRLTLTPHKSLTPEGFVWFIGATAALIMIPLVSILGNPVFWFLLPFILGAIWAIWAALKRSWRDREVVEQVLIWDDLITLDRRDPRRPVRHWEANPYWVRVILHARGGPVPHYLTLQGGDREVELGAFLTPPERVGLKDTLERAIRPIAMQ